MTLQLPDEGITYGVKRIEQFLREGMQRHAKHELESIIADINQYHRIRRIEEEIDDIDLINQAIAETRLKYDVDDATLVNVRDLMDARKSTLVEELETIDSK